MVQTIFVLRIFFLIYTRALLVSSAEARFDFRFQVSGVRFRSLISDL
jgi:hypothetical protein